MRVRWLQHARILAGDWTNPSTNRFAPALTDTHWDEAHTLGTMTCMDELGIGAELTDESKRVRSFRIGLMRRVGKEVVFKSAASIGLSADGGVFLAPAQVPGAWRYGVLESDSVAAATSAITQLRPKLHYHCSGAIYATLSGNELERRSLQLAPLPSLHNSQIFSLIAVRTWELPSRAGGMARRGDSATAVARWPDVATWTIFLLEASAEERRPLLMPGLPSIGLLAGEGYTHQVVSMSAYGREAVLLITVRTDDIWDELPTTGGIAVAALSWHPGNPTPDDRCFGLWSSRLRNPLVSWETSAPDDLTPTSTTTVKPLMDDIDRMADFTVPGEGLRMRPPVRALDDGSGTPFAIPHG
ncbi:uncharacterized protein PD653_4850 [Nocardioides sp. PD653]|nr:uncharacterized protein PD653B2_0512 [Nocardioides sp. PD653-B2]GAW57405.1 uncharacterized protein PD653_4850 [Nocardioides sp. PD653]